MCETVIVANGNFPTHEVPLSYLRKAKRIVCCDGSAAKVVASGYEPYAIVGDMDSLSVDLRQQYSHCIYRECEQETNDLTKAVTWCFASGIKDVVILGATGLREDHTLGNISLLGEYVKFMNVKMITDYGVFIPIVGNVTLPCKPSQQVSLFSFSPLTRITTKGLKYPVIDRALNSWWEATLNETENTSFEVELSGGVVLVFMNHC